MKWTMTYLLLLLSVYTWAQQTTQYTQFTFNKYGYNPAAAGSNINAKFEVICGIRQQWVGFDRAPSSNFFSGNYTFKPKRSYKRWHNAGVYVSNDNAGIFQNFGIYGSYTLHIPVTAKYNMSFGVFAGARRFSVLQSVFSVGDPVHKVSSLYFWGYPDIIPGFRLYNKRMFFDVSVQQLYKNRQVQGEKQIGNKSALTPHVYLSYGKRFSLENGFVLVPAINMHSSFTTIPSMEFNMMAYYQKKVGIGATIRGRNFISGILQLRIFKKSTIGFAYDYSINRMNSASPHTLEVMLGLTPILLMEGDRMINNVAKCPTFDF